MKTRIILNLGILLVLGTAIVLFVPVPPKYDLALIPALKSTITEIVNDK